MERVDVPSSHTRTRVETRDFRQTRLETRENVLELGYELFHCVAERKQGNKQPGCYEEQNPSRNAGWRKGNRALEGIDQLRK